MITTAPPAILLLLLLLHALQLFYIPFVLPFVVVSLLTIIIHLRDMQVISSVPCRVAGRGCVAA
jgi:hypothetical protein